MFLCQKQSHLVLLHFQGAAIARNQCSLMDFQYIFADFGKLKTAHAIAMIL